MPKPVRSNIYTYQVGNTKSIGRTYNFINARDGGLGPAFFWNNYNSSFRNSTPSEPQPPIPPDFSTASCDVLVKYFVDLIIYENAVLGIKTDFNEVSDPYNRPYIELLYPDISNRQYVTYVSTNNENYLYSVLGDDIEYDDPNVNVENERCFIVNKYIVVRPTLNVDPEIFPETKYLKIKDTEMYQVMSIGVTVPFVIPPAQAYQTTMINRSFIHIYYSGTIVYLLVDTIGKKIYIMQSYTLEIDKNLNPTSLYILKKKLVSMPPGFTYMVLTVKPESCLVAAGTITSYPSYLMRDELGNSYNYLYPDLNPNLYTQFIET